MLRHPAHRISIATLFLILGHLLPAASHAALGARESEILDRVANRYRGLASYQMTGQIILETTGSQAQRIVAPFSIAAVKPDRLRDELRHPEMGVLRVCDGQQTWTYLASLDQYTRKAGVAFQPIDSASGGGAGDRAGLSGNLLSTYQRIGSGADSASLLPAEPVTVGAQARDCWVVDVIYGASPARSNLKPGPRRYWIDKQTHEVVRSRTTAHLTTTAGPVEQQETVEFETIRLNQPVPDSLFTFSAPKSAREVENFQSGPRSADLSGQEASDFTLQDLAGRKHSLRAQRGKVVMLDFWATWCGPCRIEMPQVEKLSKEFRKRGLVVYAVNLRESASTVARFLKKNAYTMTTLLDHQGAVADKYKVQGIPTLVVIDRKGKVAAHFVGVRGESDLRAALEKAGL